MRFTQTRQPCFWKLLRGTRDEFQFTASARLGAPFASRNSLAVTKAVFRSCGLRRRSRFDIIFLERNPAASRLGTKSNNVRASDLNGRRFLLLLPELLSFDSTAITLARCRYKYLEKSIFPFAYFHEESHYRDRRLPRARACKLGDTLSLSRLRVHAEMPDVSSVVTGAGATSCSRRPRRKIPSNTLARSRILIYPNRPAVATFVPSVHRPLPALPPLSPQFAILPNEGETEADRKGERARDVFLPNQVIPPADTPTSLSAAWRYTHPLSR